MFIKIVFTNIGMLKVYPSVNQWSDKIWSLLKLNLFYFGKGMENLIFAETIFFCFGKGMYGT